MILVFAFTKPVAHDREYDFFGNGVIPALQDIACGRAIGLDFWNDEQRKARRFFHDSRTNPFADAFKKIDYIAF